MARYTDSIRRDAAAVLEKKMEAIQADHQQRADALQPYIDRLRKILDDEPVN